MFYTDHRRTDVLPALRSRRISFRTQKRWPATRLLRNCPSKRMHREQEHAVPLSQIRVPYRTLMLRMKWANGLILGCFASGPLVATRRWHLAAPCSPWRNHVVTGLSSRDTQPSALAWLYTDRGLIDRSGHCRERGHFQPGKRNSHPTTAVSRA